MAAFLTEDVFKDVLNKVLEIYRIKNLKENQKKSIRLLALDKRDVLAVLPTGYGKSLIYQVLPKLFEEGYNLLYGSKKTFSIIVVSPLEYIREQQVIKLNALGIKAVCLEKSTETDRAILSGHSYEILFGSAEQWLSSKWKKAIQEKRITNITALVVDEVHTVELW